MERERKHVLILCCLAFSVGIWALRIESLPLFVAGIVPLLITLLRRESTAAVAAVAGLGLLFFPGANFGRLFGRDSFIVVHKTMRIAAEGWPLATRELSRGFADTPYLHILTLITARTSGLGLYPSVNPEVLASALIPVLLTGGTLLFVGLLARHHLHTRVWCAGVAGVVLWIPLYTRVGLRRETLGLFFVVLAVWAIARLKAPQKVFVTLFALVGAILSHHVAGILLVLILGTWAAADRFALPTIERQVGAWALVGGVVLALWQIILGLGGEFAVAAPLAVSIRGMADLGSHTAFPQAITPPVLYRIRWYFAEYAFTGLAAIALTVGVVESYRRHGGANWLPARFAVGGVLGLLAIFAQLSSLIRADRVITYFILVAGWAWASGAMALSPSARTKVIRGCLVLFILCAALMAPLQYVSTEPNYSAGADYQRWTGNELALGDWTADYNGDRALVGDRNMDGVVSTKTGEEVQFRWTAVKQGRSNEMLVLVADRNTEQYAGKTASGQWVIMGVDVIERYNENGDKIYSNGQTSGYT